MDVFFPPRADRSRVFTKKKKKFFPLFLKVKLSKFSNFQLNDVIRKLKLRNDVTMKSLHRKQNKKS